MQTNQYSATRPQRWGLQKLNRAWLLPLLFQLLVGSSLFGANQFARVQQPGWTNRSCYSWSVAWGDYDGDGYPDLHISNATLSSGPNVDFVYRNNGLNTNAGPFTQMTTNEVGEVAGDVAISYGSTWIDLNNDQRLDLWIARYPLNATSAPVPGRVYLNQGNGKLVSVPAGDLTVPALAGFGTWGDYNNDGWLDFHAITAYATDPANWPAIRTNRLFKGKPDVMFEQVTDSVIVTSQTDYANTAAWGDYDNDGDLDLVVINGSHPSFFFRNEGNGTFVRATNAITQVTTILNNAAWGDYDNDGDLDVMITGDQSLLFRNDFPNGFVSVRNFGGGGYPAWADYDNDGSLDFVVFYGQGSIQQNRLYHNNGNGTFTSVSDPVATAGRWVVGAWADYDNDGFMDLFATSAVGANALYHNLGNPTNHWIKFKLKGSASNAAAIGAKIRVKAIIRGQTVWQMREISAGPWPQDDMRPNFGLGDATNVDLVRIEWPSGNVQEFVNAAPDQMLTVTEFVGITPVRPTASLNGSATLTRLYVSDATYQWRFDGVELVGQTNRILNLTNLVADQEGRYSVVVSNASTLVTNFVHLSVDTQFSKITAEPWNTDLGNSWTGVVGDYNGDGYQDMFIARYGVGRSVLYHNNTNGTFANITNSTFPLVGDYGFGPCSDFDNDGRTDLFVWPGPSIPSSFFYGNGDGSFAQAPLAAFANLWVASAVDYDHDGLLDLYCSAWGGAPNRLFRNLGGRTFQAKTIAEVGSILGVSTSGGAAWADYDDDGWEDVAQPVRNPSGCRLFRNLGGRFVAVTNQISQAAINALVVGWGDYDNDGRVDLCVGAIGGQSTVYRNLGGGNFERASIGVTIQGQYNGVAWADYDNDGFLDLFMTYYGTDHGNSLFRNNGNGTFTAITTGSLVTDRLPAGAASYAGLWFDYDNDGFLDPFVPNGNDAGTASVPNFLYRNNGNSNAWLKVKLVGTTSNREGAGAKVRVRATYAGASRWQRRDITSGGDPCNGMGTIAHFGLGNATSITTLRIEWPSGTVQEFQTLANNQMLTIVEPRRPVLALEATPAGFTGTLNADANQTYQLHASEDVATSWTILSNITTDANGTANWSEPVASPQGRRFYKAVGTVTP